MADKVPLVRSGNTIKQMLATDKVPIVNLATGTPDGTKFIRDDGVLAVPVAADTVANKLIMFYNFI